MIKGLAAITVLLTYLFVMYYSLFNVSEELVNMII